MTLNSQQKQFVNIAYYKFVSIFDLSCLRETFLSLCNRLEIKGTIILSTEGINSCLVGTRHQIDDFIAFMRDDSRFSDIEFKESYSDKIPFRRMLVKVKKEIIPMGNSSVKPEFFTGKYIQAMELKKWFDEGEDFLILDTRNDYEVSLGTFRGAVNPNLKHFRNFSQWVENNFADKKDKKIVTFCTGGIRCEKASALMRQEGFDEVYQLQGGILKYLEETHKSDSLKGTHSDNYYDGDCFVFDYRVALDKNLNQADYELCYNCWMPLKPDDVQNSLYEKGKHCPHCFKVSTQDYTDSVVLLQPSE